MPAREPKTPFVGTLGAFDLTHILHVRMLHGGLSYYLENETLGKEDNIGISPLLWLVHKNTFRRQSIKELASIMRKDVLIREILHFFLDADTADDTALLEAAGELRKFVDRLVHHKVNYDDTKSENDKSKWAELAVKWCQRHPLYVPLALMPSVDFTRATVIKEASPDFDASFDGSIDSEVGNEMRSITSANYKSRAITRINAFNIGRFEAATPESGARLGHFEPLALTNDSQPSNTNRVQLGIFEVSGFGAPELRPTYRGLGNVSGWTFSRDESRARGLLVFNTPRSGAQKKPTNDPGALMTALTAISHVHPSLTSRKESGERAEKGTSIKSGGAAIARLSRPTRSETRIGNVAARIPSSGINLPTVSEQIAAAVQRQRTLIEIKAASGDVAPNRPVLPVGDEVTNTKFSARGLSLIFELDPKYPHINSNMGKSPHLGGGRDKRITVNHSTKITMASFAGPHNVLVPAVAPAVAPAMQRPIPRAGINKARHQVARQKSNSYGGSIRKRDTTSDLLAGAAKPQTTRKIKLRAATPAVAGNNREEWDELSREFLRVLDEEFGADDGTGEDHVDNRCGRKRGLQQGKGQQSKRSRKC